MELIKGLNEKLIAELIPEVGPRMIFISYWKTKFSEQESNTTLDTEINVGCVKKYCVLFRFIEFK